MAGTAEYPALGFDPAPGVVSNVESVATNLQQVAQRMGSAHDALSKIGRSDGLWQGEAADAFRGTVDELPKHLDQAHRSMGHAAQAMARWSQDLSSMQQKARGQEAEAVEAQRRLKQAESNPNLGLANQHFPDQASLQQAQQKLDSAQAEVDGANRDLEAIRGQAKRLQEQHGELAAKVEEALRKAKEEAPEAPDLLERLGNFLEDVGKGISDAAGKAWQWVQDHADDINKVGDVLSTVGTVLSVVAAATSWIPGVNAVTTAAAVGVSAAALGAHALAKAGGAKVSGSTMAFDALGAIPGGGAAKGAVGSAKVLPKAARAAKGAEGGLKASSQAASQVLRESGQQAVGGGAKMSKKLFGLGEADVRSVESGGRSALNRATLGHLGGEAKVHYAESGRAVAAGASTLAVKNSAVMVGKWEAQPYIEQGESVVKDHAGKASDGFQKALSGRAS